MKPNNHGRHSRMFLSGIHKNLFKDWIPAFAGMTAYVVGGAVRDRLLGRSIMDFDLVLPKNPSRLADQIAARTKGTAFVLDPERNVYRVVFQDPTSGQKCNLDLAERQGSSLEDDIDRRDFSINALAVPLEKWLSPSWKKAIVDRHNGLRDLKQKKIEALKAAPFQEDPLRLLRAFRIAAELGFTVSSTTLAQIKKHRRLIRKSAKERIRDEFLKQFLSAGSHGALLLMEKAGLLETLLPEVSRLRSTAPRYYGKGGVLKHTLDSLWLFEQLIHNLSSWFPRCHKRIRTYLAEKISGYPRVAHLKWGLLLHDFGKPATAKVIGGRLRFFEHEHVGADMIPKIAPRFRWSAEETSRYARLVRNHMRPGNLATHPEITDKAIHRFFRDLEDDAVGMLLVSLADHLSYLTPAQRKKRSSDHEKLTIKMINLFYNRREKVSPPKLLDGHDLMKAFSLKPSPLIGKLLEELKDAQSEGNVKTKAEGLTYLRGRLAELQETPT